MNDNVSRRRFVSSGVAIAATPALATPVGHLLAPQKAEQLVIDTLEKYSKIGRIDLVMAQEFLNRLMTPGLHTESPETFKGWLEGAPGFEENLEAYILEEFVAHTNYFSVVEGYEKKLRFRTPETDLLSELT